MRRPFLKKVNACAGAPMEKNKALKDGNPPARKNAGGPFYIPEKTTILPISFPLVLCYDRGGNRLWELSVIRKRRRKEG